MRCVILNRNYPPNPGITGHSAAEIAEHLNDRGVEVHIVTVGSNHRAKDGPNPSIEIHEVRDLYGGKNKLLRLIASLIEGRNMAAKAAALGIAPIITLTDPPLLNYWVARICRRLQRPWIYWSMDIYPDAFVAAGLASPSGLLYRHFKRVSLASVPQHLVGLGQKQADYLQAHYPERVPTSILPCGVNPVEPAEHRPKWMPDDKKTTFCYIGNLGQAHDPRFVELVITALDPKIHHFYLSVYGIHAARLLRHAAQFSHVTVLPSVDRSELGFMDIHLASLEPAWDHVCVPSKAVSAVCAGGCLLLCASDQGDNWNLLHEAAWRIEPGSGMAEEVAGFVSKLTAAAVAEKRRRANSIREELIGMKSRAFDAVFDAVKTIAG
ncbi:MAG: glycosyltransferase [Verrucomicrobiota bacterium]